MHPKAKEYDRTHGLPDVSFSGNRTPPKVLPLFDAPPADRPCDWCGEPTGIVGSYIHPKCKDLERDFWLDLVC